MPQFGFEPEITLLKSIIRWLVTCLGSQGHTLTTILPATTSFQLVNLLISILLLCPNVCLAPNPSWRYSELSCEECVWPFKCEATKLHSLQLILSSDHVSTWTNYCSHKPTQQQLWIESILNLIQISSVFLPP